jgi:hypothetical protein
MILKKNTERCRTMAPNPEVPVKPHGFALNVKKCQSNRSVRIRPTGFPFQDRPAGTLQFRILVKRVTLDKSQLCLGFVGTPNLNLQRAVPSHMDVGPKLSSHDIGRQ